MKYQPIITVGRQYGSGGRYVAKLLSEKLGIPFYEQSYDSVLYYQRKNKKSVTIL